MKKILYFAVAAAMVVASCSNEEVVTPQNETFTITATIGNPESRTSYTDETAEANKGLKVNWEANEKITVAKLEGGTLKEVYQFTSTNAAGATATFIAPTGFVKDEKATYMAFYPPIEECTTYSHNHSGIYYSSLPNGSWKDYMNHGEEGFKMNVNSTYLTLNLNNIMQQTSNNDMSHLKHYDLMTSDVDFNSNNASINFKKQTAILKFNLTIPDEAKNWPATKLKLELPSTKVYYYAKNLYFEDGHLNNQGSAAGIEQHLGTFEQADAYISTGFTPATTTLTIYRPVLSGTLYAGDYSILLTFIESDFTEHLCFKDKTLETDMNIEAGKVYVIDADLTKSY